LASRLRLALAGGPKRYASLLNLLAATGNEHDGWPEARLRTVIDELAALGFINLIPPWPTHEVHLERRLLGLTRSLPDDPFPELALILERLLVLEKGHAGASIPEHSVAAMEATLGQLMNAVERLAGIPGALPHHGGFFEDVLQLTPAPARGENESLQVTRQCVTEIMRTAELVSRFCAVFNHRHDVLHTLAAYWSDRWPARREIPLLTLFDEFQVLWKAYLAFDAKERYSDLSSFNPLGLDTVDGLAALRNEILVEASRLMRLSPHGKTLMEADLEMLLARVPRAYRPLLGPCVFVQPADAAGSSWVLNRLFEGTGRYLSRYGAVMEAPMQHRFTSHLAERSTLAAEDGEADLMDLMFSGGAMTNLRLPQTARVLELPGEHVDLPSHRVVHLKDLCVRADLDTWAFSLQDSSGRRLIPAHMSSSNNLYMPVLLRFLSVFGPYEVRQVLPRPAAEIAGDAIVTDRLSCASLVIRRRRWEFHQHSEFLSELSPGPEAFSRIDHWRQTAGLPRQLFVYEQMHDDQGVVESFKPQYIDFSSPSLVALFLAVLKKNHRRLLFEEALPLFSDFPADTAGEARALEFQIDSLALRERAAVSLHQRADRTLSRGA
jgi:hypothetical protein